MAVARMVLGGKGQLCLVFWRGAVTYIIYSHQERTKHKRDHDDNEAHAMGILGRKLVRMLDWHDAYDIFVLFLLVQWFRILREPIALVSLFGLKIGTRHHALGLLFCLERVMRWKVRYSSGVSTLSTVGVLSFFCVNASDVSTLGEEI